MDTTTSIEVNKLDGPGILVELSGEFDVHDLNLLGKALEDAASSGAPTCVGLSGVTFLDARCARELAVHSRLQDGHLALRNPSWQVQATFRACGLDHIGNLSRKGPFRPAEASKDEWVKPSETLAVTL